MRRNALAALKFGILVVVFSLTIWPAKVRSQELPVEPDGNKIEGVWDSHLTYKNCTTGAVLFTGQSLVAYAQGGVVVDISSGAAPSGRYPGLGVWRHLQGRDYQSAFKQFRYNSNGTFAGKIIAIVEIKHEMDDTLTTSAVGTIYDATGNVVSTVCPTGVATRFTGEN